MANKMREFTRNDWRTYSGGESFPDGASPWVGEYNDFVVAVDGSGLQAWVYDHEMEGLFIPLINRDFGILIGNQILSDIEGLDNDEIVAYLKAHNRP